MSKILTLVGKIKRHPDGFGFLIPDLPTDPDIYIPKHLMTGIMSLDRVEVKAEKEKHSGFSKQSPKYRARSIEVLNRGLKSAVGVPQKLHGQQWILADEAQTWGEDILLETPDKHVHPQLEEKLCEVEIIEFRNPSDPSSRLRGKIVNVLGSPEDANLDVQRALIQNHVPRQFSPETISVAQKLPSSVSSQDIQSRKDLRNHPFVTIDGATAKDFDDAILVEKTKSGFQLFVAIADVAHYVREGSPIDRDAYERGTSVYFPHTVVPMLPEQLSNHLCSLLPGQDRLVMVCEIHYNFLGQVQKSFIYDSVIHSKARITYGEAQELIDGEDLESFRHVKQHILQASELAHLLLKNRMERGSLDLEVPEVELMINDQGEPQDIVKVSRLFSHRLIEELMLAANVAVGEYLAQRGEALFRIHDNPKPDALSTLQNFANSFGYRGSLSGSQLQKKLNSMLSFFEGQTQGQILHMLTLRSMAQAKYSPENIGHFGLGFETYSHFTSPIRRYPDLIVHRLLKKHLSKKGAASGALYEDLATAGVHLSACEQRANKAERMVESVKKARYMIHREGQEFEGMISGVTRFGVFVLLRGLEMDGLVKLDDLGNEPFYFDEVHFFLRGKKTGRIFKLGDPLKIRVKSADIDAGQINFELAAKNQQISQESRDFKGRNKSQRGFQERKASSNKRREKDRDRERERDSQSPNKNDKGKKRSSNNERDQNRQNNQAKDQSAGSSRWSFGNKKKSKSNKKSKPAKKGRFSIPISHR